MKWVKKKNKIAAQEAAAAAETVASDVIALKAVPAKKVQEPAAVKKYTLDINKCIWIFTIGSLFGYILETLWYFSQRGYWLNRQGMVYGPFSQIYGFGAVIICLCLNWLQGKNSTYTFLGSAVLGSSFEYLASVFQEKVFGVVSWNYSNQAWNLNGRISLSMAFIWGIAGMLFMKHTYPWMMEQLEKIPKKIGVILARCLLVFFIFDLSLSSAALYRQMERREGVPANNIVREFLDEHFDDERLDSIYTTAKPVPRK